MPPEAEQINSICIGLTMGEATAAHKDNANHASAMRAIRRALRSLCIGAIVPQKSLFIDRKGPPVSVGGR